MTPSIKPSTERLITDALAIEAEEAQTAGALGFMARAMVQATLPHRKVDGNEFERRNGAFTLSITAPSRVGLPYGSMPRLLLAWLTTEAVRTKSREIELGGSLSEFMHDLGLNATGGTRGDITRMKNQITRLFASTITAIYEGQGQTEILNRAVAERASLWWHAKAPEQVGLWKSTVTLSEPFFREVIDRPVPIDMRAIKALKRSPMALDVYCWLTYRASYARKDSEIPWAALAMQFGSSYARQRDFQAAFLTELKKVTTVYPEARLEVTKGGVLLKPTVPHVLPKAG